MSNFNSPLRARAFREFTIRRNTRGRWIVSEIHGQTKGIFTSLTGALRFALSEVDGDVDRVHIAASEDDGDQ